MNKPLSYLLLAVTLLIAPVRAEYRTWTNTEGVNIEAEFVKAEGENVTLRMRGGKLSTFSQSKLSTADQEFIKSNKDILTEAKTVPSNRKAKWLSQMDKAQEQSKETGLPILVLFTGTSWCPYCIKLEKAVFSNSEFKSFADQNLVLLMLDFGPGGTPKNKKDGQLAKDFKVNGYPSYFLTDATGKQYANGGYHDGISPSSFAEWVKESAPK